MKIDAKLHLNINNKDGADIQKLCKQLTYANPKFFEAKRLGFSTYGIDSEIKNYGISPDGTKLVTTRGEITKVRAIFPEEIIIDRAEPYVLGTYKKLEYHNPDFDLDERQLRAVEAISKKKQGIVHASTSAGKSAIIMASIAKRKVRVLVIVHRKILLEQLKSDAEKWLKGCTIGQIGNGKYDTDAIVTFAIDKSLYQLLLRQPDLKDHWEMVIQDECHLSPCSTFQNIINTLDAPYRYGLTGTLKRKDGMEFLIHATYGQVIATITKDELLAADRVSPVQINIIESNAEVDPAFFDLPTTKRWQMIDKSLHEDPDRGGLVLDVVKELLKNPDARIVVLSRYVGPTERLAQDIYDCLHEPVGVVNGQRDDAKITCEEFEAGDHRVLCATIGCFSTGVNIPNLTDIILISPIFNNELLIHQIRGRLMRKSDGKTHGTLHFIWDQWVFEAHNLNRFKVIMKK